MTELLGAWRRKDVRLGLLGTLLIALGSLTPAYLPQASPVWDLLRVAGLTGTITKWGGTLFVLVGLVVLIDAWFKLRTDKVLRHWAVLAIWSIPFVLSPPIFSHDAYSYAAHGWLLHNGLNPYQVGPGILPGVFADQVAWVWRFTPSPYGPLALQLSWLLDWVAGFDPFWSAMMMRVPALIGVGLIGFFLPKIAAMRGDDVHVVGWFGILNPVLVIDFVGGAHNDALMVGLMVFAIWVTYRTSWWLVGAAIIGVGAAIKQPAFLAAVALPFIVSQWTSWRVRPLLMAAGKALVSLGVAAASFALISIATGLNFGWLNAVNVPGAVITVSPFTIVGWLTQQVLDHFAIGTPGIALTSARVLGMVSAAAILVYLGIKDLGRRPIRFIAWSFIAVALCAPAFHSWYVMWGAVLLPLTKLSPKMTKVALWSTMVMLSYAAINLSNRNESIALGVAVVGLFYQTLRTHERAFKEIS